MSTGSKELERTSLFNNDNRNNAVLSFYALPCCSYHSTQSQTTSLTENRANMTLTLLGFNMQSSHKYHRINAIIWQAFNYALLKNHMLPHKLQNTSSSCLLLLDLSKGRVIIWCLFPLNSRGQWNVSLQKSSLKVSRDRDSLYSL